MELNPTLIEDEKFMRQAINEAQRALSKEEIPIGAVVVCGGRVIGRGHNLTETRTRSQVIAEEGEAGLTSYYDAPAK